MGDELLRVLPVADAAPAWSERASHTHVVVKGLARGRGAPVQWCAAGQQGAAAPHPDESKLGQPALAVRTPPRQPNPPLDPSLPYLQRSVSLHRALLALCSGLWRVSLGGPPNGEQPGVFRAPFAPWPVEAHST